MARWRPATLISFLVVVSIMFGLAACSSGQVSTGGGESATPTPIPTSVVPTNPTYEVQRGDVIRELQFSGRVAPILEEELFFKTGGYVESVYVRRNDSVEEGDLLTELEVTDLKNQIIQKEAELLSVQMDYERRMTEAQNSVRAAELNLAKLQASASDASTLSARINLERARTRLADAQDEYNKALDRSWEKEEVRVAYANGVQEAQWNLDMAQAQYNDVMRGLQRATYDIELAQMNLDMAQLRAAEVGAGLDITRTVLSLNRLKDQLSDARIVAPFDGVILQINVMEGRQVQGYNAMLVIADPTELEITADLQDSEKSELSEGMELVAEFLNRPGEKMSGVIRRLPYPYSGAGRTSGVDDADKSVRITLDGVDPAEAGYTIGDRFRMTVELERSEGTLWLPPQAVRTFEGRSFVVIQEGGGQRRVDVRLGIRSPERVEILDGVIEGQLVIAP
jgi:multidrug efflux pump subunit AcrA (membrane-fusion protein)